MVRSKRLLSPSGSQSPSKRVCVQPPDDADFIIIDDDEQEKHIAQSTLSTPKRMRAIYSPPGSDSDIELIDDPETINTLKKNKGKQRATPRSPGKVRPKRLIRNVDAEDGFADIVDSDAKLARQMAMEWGAERSPPPRAGPSGSASAALGPSSHLDVGRTGSFGAPKEFKLPLSPLKTPLGTKDAKPVRTAAIDFASSSLDVPYVKLPNPLEHLGDIQKLLAVKHRCTHCGGELSVPDPRDIRSTGYNRIPITILLSLHLECLNPQCCAPHCRGCSASLSCYPLCTHTSDPPNPCSALKCCADARAIGLYEALAAFDQHYLAEEVSSNQQVYSLQKPSGSKVKTVGPGGTGYSTGSGVNGDDDDGFDPSVADLMGILHEKDIDLGSESWDDVDMVYSDNDDSDSEMPDLSQIIEYVEKGPQIVAGLCKLEDVIMTTPKKTLSTKVMDHHRATRCLSWRPTEYTSIERVVDISEPDKYLVQTFTTLTNLLPSPYSDEPAAHDLLPNSSIGTLILMSYIPTVLAQLLRNDSVTDWIARSRVYHAMLTLLKRMADNELTIPVLVGYRPEFDSRDGLSGILSLSSDPSFSSAQTTWASTSTLTSTSLRDFDWKRDDQGAIELSPPLLKHFRKLKRQAETFLRSTTSQFNCLDEDEQMGDVINLVDGLSLCQDIVAAQDDIKRAMGALRFMFEEQSDDKVLATYGPTRPPMRTTKQTRPHAHSRQSKRSTSQRGKGKGRTGAQAEGASSSVIQAAPFNIEKEYISSCEKLAFSHISLSYKEFHFRNELVKADNLARNPKARFHFAKEMAVMSTSLPPGIWVRVDEVRNDIIKVMIAGPQGTPYAGGLFEFDCFIPLEYPNKPPMMNLQTTGKGTVRFNPNLYNSGKVCLSLLGTWSGSPEERWTSKSTILQVLVSIQSMILNEAPYYNEPGHGKANLKSQASIKYNRDTALQTVRWAMVDWLKDKHRNGIWKDVIKSHFSLLKDKIRQQILAWAAEDPRMNEYTSSLRPCIRLTPPPPQPPRLTALQNQAFGGLRLPPPPAPSKPASVDLVAEFDKGMARVEAWPSSED